MILAGALASQSSVDSAAKSSDQSLVPSQELVAQKFDGGCNPSDGESAKSDRSGEHIHVLSNPSGVQSNISKHVRFAEQRIKH